MNSKRSLLGTALMVASLAGATALAACGSNTAQTKSADGTVTLTSLPTSQVFVDGAVKGTTPLTLTLPSGDHKVVLKADGFVDASHTVAVKPGVRTIEYSLTAIDSEDPRVIGLLAKDLGFEIPPAEEIQVHRGAAKESIAVILWPQGDVRKTGLGTFRLDVSDSSNNNGVLRFKHGKTILYERPFNPDQLVTWEPIPAEVIAGVSKGDKITWGLYFDGPKSPKDITATFEIVDKPQVDSAMAKIDTNKAYQRQDALSRELLKGETLQNYRLYTEAMAKYVEILMADPNTWLPFRGMVASLRRMGAEESSLYAELAQFVQGKGQNGGRGASTGLGEIPNGLKMGNKPTLVTYNEGLARATEKAAHAGDKTGPATVAPVVSDSDATGEESTTSVPVVSSRLMELNDARLHATATEERARALQAALDYSNTAQANAHAAIEKQKAAQAALDALLASPVAPGDPGDTAYAQAVEDARKAVAAADDAVAQAQLTAQEAMANAPTQDEVDMARREADNAKHIANQLAEQFAAEGGVVPTGEPGPGPDGPAHVGEVDAPADVPGVAPGQNTSPSPEQAAINLAGAQERLATFQAQAAGAQTAQANAQAAFEAAVAGGDPDVIQMAQNNLNLANEALQQANQKVQGAQALVQKILQQIAGMGPH